jgi:peptidyl-tRNA hydrolase
MNATRHSVGYHVIDHLRSLLSLPQLEPHPSLPLRMVRGTLPPADDPRRIRMGPTAPDEIVLVKNHTYMNVCGPPILKAGECAGGIRDSGFVGGTVLRG